jgi:hypothetical protein
MPSFTSSSDLSGRAAGRNAWRRFFVLTAATAAMGAALLYGFIALVDPFDSLPFSLPANRAPVATNARFSFPALARKAEFDSAIIGTSTSRLLRPAALDPAFGARFVNLAMNAATAYEQSRLLEVFARAHQRPLAVLVGIDLVWCATGDRLERYTPRPFPEWLYREGRAGDYLHLFNLYALEQAGAQFAIISGLKPPHYGRDGYTSFVPPDSAYDPGRVAAHLRAEGVAAVPGVRAGAPASWRFPALELLNRDLARLPPTTTKLLFFVPYNHVLLPQRGPAAAAWGECKRRVADLATDLAGAVVVDFMIPSPITSADNNYWDGLHYRVGIADRLAQDLALAARGDSSRDYQILALSLGFARSRHTNARSQFAGELGARLRAIPVGPWGRRYNPMRAER